MPEAFIVDDASPIDEDIVRLEWAGPVALSDGTGADFYPRMLADDAVMVLPMGTMSGDATIEAFAEAPAGGSSCTSRRRPRSV